MIYIFVNIFLLCSSIISITSFQLSSTITSTTKANLRSICSRRSSIQKKEISKINRVSRLSIASGTNFFDKISSQARNLQEKFNNKQQPTKLSEEDELLEFLNEKPWRATKIKNLNINYYPWKETWRERFRYPIDQSTGQVINDDSINIYTIPSFRFPADCTRLHEIWGFPWMWTTNKAERLSWINKYFLDDVDSLSVQEHMELDNFFSEFDMPMRWGIIRIKEADVLNVIALNLVVWTDFNGIKPTDLGLRPDGTVRTCPVQFHNCISSSNFPTDTEHYAPPFRWSRSKSPDQAYDEIKGMYTNYPKRGLRWTSGWIDRGGWRAQEFSGSYFHAEADEIVFQYTDDIELVLDVPKREVLYRSSARLGQSDCDTQRLRYNQFVRMLKLKGGWEVESLPQIKWFSTTPFRWTQLFLDKSANAIESVLDASVSQFTDLSVNNGDEGGDKNSMTTGAARRAFAELAAYIDPYIQPIVTKATDIYEGVRLDPRVAAVVQKMGEFDEWINSATSASSSSQISHDGVDGYINSVLRLLPDRIPEQPPLPSLPIPTIPLPSLPFVENLKLPSPLSSSKFIVDSNSNSVDVENGREKEGSSDTATKYVDRLGEDAKTVMNRFLDIRDNGNKPLSARQVDDFENRDRDRDSDDDRGSKSKLWIRSSAKSRIATSTRSTGTGTSIERNTNNDNDNNNNNNNNNNGKSKADYRSSKQAATTENENEYEENDISTDDSNSDNVVEWLLETLDTNEAETSQSTYQSATSTSTSKRRAKLSESERRLLKAQLLELKKTLKSNN